MLKLVLGRSGFGKTEYIRDKALEFAQNNENVLLIVPDQMSFDTEKDMIYAKDIKTASKVNVFHFGRLCEDIFRTFGGITENRIDDCGRSLVMALAVGACKDQLELFGKTKETDLCAVMINAVNEFKNCGICPEDLIKMQEKCTGALKLKLGEIAIIYKAYEAILESEYIEPWDLEIRAGKIVSQTEYFKDRVVLIDGFEGFDSRKMQLIKTMLCQAKDVYISFCVDDIYAENENSIFAPIRATARKIIALAKENNVKIAPHIKLEKQCRFVEKDLIALEENIFRHEKTELFESENVIVFGAKDLYEEVEYICATINNLVQNGYKYGDISVICGNENKFTNALENSFKKWDIPAFITAPRAVNSSPIIRLVLTAFQILESGYRTESVLSLAKTGLCGLSAEQISKLENYVYMWKIDGNMWKEAFVKSPFGFSKQEYTNEISELEFFRKTIIEPLISFKESCKSASGEGISENVYNLLKTYKCDEIILENCKKLEELFLQEEAQEQIRIWEKLMEILDKFARIIGSRSIHYKKYSSLLEEIVSVQEMMDIPLRLDCVMYGCANNIKYSAKIVFVVGCVQDEFPKIPEEKGIFTQTERSTLIAEQFPFENDQQDLMLLERFYAYTAVCSAREKLFFSYHSADGKNDHIKSEIIVNVLDILNINTIKNLPIEYFATKENPLFTAYAKEYRHNSAKGKTFQKLLNELPDFKKRLETLDNVTAQKEINIAPNTAKKIFANTKFSPSQIEVYHHCKFQYFCRYGLGAKERKTAQIDVLQYGTLMHYIFEKILQEDNLQELKKEDVISKVTVLTQSYLDEEMGGVQNLSVYDVYRFKRMVDTAVVIVLRLIDEIAQSEFIPKYMELKLGETQQFPTLKIKTKDGNDIEVYGIIDRVDLYQKDDINYVRVVDYKTGTKEFKYGDVLNGLNLQMLMYLSALKNIGYLPAGALYMPSAYPTVSAKKGDTADKIEDARYKKMQMKGFVLNQGEIITAMEKAVEGKFIPLRLRKNGNFYSEEYLLNMEQLDKICDHAKALVATMADNILMGKIEANPLMKDTNSCAWCPYNPICGKEEQEKEKFSLSKAELLKKLGEVTADEDMD